MASAAGSAMPVAVDEEGKSPYTLRALPLTFRNMASIPKESVTIAARTKTAPGRLLAIRAARAAVHATAATTEIHAADPRSLAVLASATFTTAKIPPPTMPPMPIATAPHSPTRPEPQGEGRPTVRPFPYQGGPEP